MTTDSPKRALTPTVVGFAAGLVASAYAFPLYHLLSLYQPSTLYFFSAFPSWVFFASVILSLAAAFTVVLGLCWLAGRGGISSQAIEGALGAATILALILILVISRRTSPRILGIPTSLLVALLAIAGVGVCVSGTRVGFIGRTLFSRLCLMLATGCLLVLGYEIAAGLLSSGSPGKSRFVQTKSKSRLVVVILFDELDDELTFHLRPARIALPNLEKFDSESFHAAAEPSAHMTIQAIPSLLTGEMLSSAEPRSPGQLELYGTDGKRSRWDAGKTVFAKLKAEGINSAVLGWHHPYCRVLGSEVAECETYPNMDATDACRLETYRAEKGLTLFPPFLKPTRDIVEQYDVVARLQYAQVGSGLRTVSSWLADRRIGFIWAHFPTPHPPGIVPATSSQSHPNYFDNLTLVDSIVGKVITELKRDGRWDDSILAVTGDHELRAWIGRVQPGWTAEEERLTQIRKHERVPLMVHLSGQKEHVSYDGPVNALVLHDLILEWEEGHLLDPAGLVSWFSAPGSKTAKPIASRVAAPPG